MRVVLASASPARSSLLDRAGVRFHVVVSGVDEDAISAPDPAGLVLALARAKGEAVAAGVAATEPTLVIAADTVLLVDGEVQGKPHTADVARARWRAQRGRAGDVLTGHHVSLVGAGATRSAAAVATTRVWFADVSDATVDAYVASGEPLAAAGAFKIDGLGGALIDRVDGDPQNVIGLSLPVLRDLVDGLGVPWHTLWGPP